ncbi:polysaccharide deacetylase family protein [Chromobacterium sp. Panama]|uniref:polysaccharide deacetylase family protein n=1 Tax=Chromobacterium sp. Panama TaxID=2161826 RepID=UPI0011B222D9|nr:polysaccharide deacetylase family protein [Chromobacterium sp. Panama]
MNKIRSCPLWVFIILLLGLLLAASAIWHKLSASRTPPPRAFIALLLPDKPASNKYALAWQDAANEGGVAMMQITASQLVDMEPEQRARIRGIILPDTIHRHVDAALAGVLEEYVQAGGALWINYDAASENAGGRFLDKPTLARMVGVDYLLYRELGKQMVRRDLMLMSPSAVAELGITPGRFQPYAGGKPSLLQASTYGYDQAAFSYLATRGSFQGRVLAEGPDGTLIASLRDYGRGKVLFVNLPVTFLKIRTDGLWLQSYLNFFNTRVLHLPQLASVPDGVGGLVMNWHVDDANAIPYLDLLKKLGFLEQGPYSVHFTTGPDTNQPGDRRGMDLAHNAQAQDWVRRLRALGYDIGAHGGWMHNYFAFNINEHNGKQWASYLANNKQDLENLTQQALTEYSAPNGHHPDWVTAWLRQHGVLAYYYVGDLSMGPTRTYIDPADMHDRPWAFPVSANGGIASFEEAVRNKLPSEQMTLWLQDMTRFAVQQRVARLVYFHPPGVYFYQQTVKQWLAQTRALRDQGVFHWYTMTQLSRFLSQRELTQWQVAPAEGRDASWVSVSAHNPGSLARQSWLLPKSSARPVLRSGKAEIEALPDAWRVSAQSGQDLRFDYLQTTSDTTETRHAQ